MMCKESLCLNGRSLSCSKSKNHDGLHEAYTMDYGELQWGMIDHTPEKDQYLITHAKFVLRLPDEARRKSTFWPVVSFIIVTSILTAAGIVMFW